MKLKAAIEKIPGGMMVVPLVLGALLNTFTPEALEIGGFTTALFKNGAAPLIGAFLLCMGAGISFKAAPQALLQGGTITLTKLLVAMALGLGVERLFGADGVFGLTGVAIIAAMSNSNGGLYAALVGEFGNERDVGAISILSLNDGPFFTMKNRRNIIANSATGCTVEFHTIGGKGTSGGVGPAAFSWRRPAG